MHTADLYVGAISGTSADSIDAVLVDLSEHPRLIATHSLPLSNTIKQQIFALCLPGDNEIDRLGRLTRTLGTQFAECINALLSAASVPGSQVAAIGSHGQTIRHRPCDRDTPAGAAFTLQIGDPNTIAELTGITTVADFRGRDIAAGGQGAPLVPAFHRAAFYDPTVDRAIVNIGGMANVTFLTRAGAVSGFDTGPGNALMDAWIARHRQMDFDQGGAWAAQGEMIPALLERLLAHPFFDSPAPKSTGREMFHLAWLEQQLADSAQAAPADVQATLLELTARTIATSIDTATTASDEIYLCGGGAYNKQLSTRLAALLAPRLVESTSRLGIDPRWVEASAFAWLAQQTLAARPGNVPAVTGARKPVILGAIYPGGQISER